MDNKNSKPLDMISAFELKGAGLQALLRTIGDNDLLAQYLDSPDWGVRVAAALELGKRGDERAIELLTVAFYEADSATCAQIVAVLGEAADEVATDLLVDVLNEVEEYHPLVRKEVANALRKMARREKEGETLPIREALEAASDGLAWLALTDNDRGVAEASALALATIQGEEAIAILGKVSDNSLRERLRMIDALVAMKKALNPERIRGELLNSLKDEALQVRLAAIQALKPVLSPHKAVVKALRELYKADQNEEVRQAAGLALGDLRPKVLSQQPILKIAVAILMSLLFGWMVSSLGALFYQPKDLLPQAESLPQKGIYAPNESVTAWLDAFLSLLEQEQPLSAINTLQLDETQAFRLVCPRNMLDIFFGKRKCEALIFMAFSSNSPLNLSFLVFRDQKEIKSLALGIEALNGTPDGLFIELLAEGEHEEVSQQLRSQVESILESKHYVWTDYTFENKDIFVPFVAFPEDIEEVQDLQSNPVVQHLLLKINYLSPEVSLGARIFAVRDAGASALYNLSFKVVQRSIFQQPNDANTLAHELVHAALDQIEDKESLLQQIRGHLNPTHPRLFNTTLPLFYDVTGADGETIAVEESLAFLTGTLAASQERVYFVIQNQDVDDLASDVRWLAEPLLSSDVELLVALELVPEWMSPKALGYHDYKITRDYYELANQYLLVK